METQINSTNNPNPSHPANSTILHSNEFQLVTINTYAPTPFKLTTNNYISWKLQFYTLFIGYNLLSYIDGSKPCPLATIITNQSTLPNPAYNVWIHQDQLIINALIGSLSPTIITFVARSRTTQEAWTILSKTYTKPSRRHIK